MKKLIPLFAFVFIVGTLPLLSGCGNPAENLGPAESMQALMQGVADQKLEAFWNGVPDSYQQQINDQTHELAAKMDPELYDGIFSTAQRLTKLLKDKKEFILKNQMIQGLPVPQEKVSEFWDPTVDILTQISNGEISSVKKLKSFDGKSYFSSEGNAILKEVFQITELFPRKEGELSFRERIKQTKVSLVSQDGDKATIKIEAPDEKTREQVMVKVDNKWIPEKLASTWDKQLEQSRQNISEITPEMMEAQKQKIMPVLKNINETLAQLESAKTEEEFNNKLSPIIAPVAMFAPMLMMQLGQQPMMGGPGPGGPSLGENKPADPNQIVTIVIEKKLSNAEQDPIIEQILLSVDDSEQVNIVPMAEGETTIFKISPVTDVEAFAKKIKFGKPAKVDAKKRSITVELEK